MQITKKFFTHFRKFMIKIPNSEIYALNKNFNRFKKQIITSRKQDNAYFISQLIKYKKEYEKAGIEEYFASKIFEFAQQMRKIGIDDFAGMIYSTLMKMPFINPMTKETYAITGLNFAIEHKDSIHIHARLVDLKNLYKHTNHRHKYIRVLFQEEKELTKICDDYKMAKINYRTLVREQSPLKKYEIELAKTRVDVAKVILKTNPQKAKIMLEKASKTFEKESRDKEVKFINIMLSEIKHSV